MDEPSKGGCQCGACTYRFTGEPLVAYTCHCLTCQKLTASAFLTCLWIPTENLEKRSGDPSCHVRNTDSGNSLRTWFCGDCGSTLYAENSARPHLRTVHVGSLDTAEVIEVTRHIWVKRKLPWVVLPPEHSIYQQSLNWQL
jgi:hypothetical protein